MNRLKSFQTFSKNEGLSDLVFSKKKTPKEKLDKYFHNVKLSYNKVCEEAGGEENLSKGVSLEYENFGKFADGCYMCVQILMEIGSKEGVETYDELCEMCNKVNHVRGVSSYSSSQFSYVKRNLSLMKSKFS